MFLTFPEKKESLRGRYLLKGQPLKIDEWGAMCAWLRERNGVVPREKGKKYLRFCRLFPYVSGGGLLRMENDCAQVSEGEEMRKRDVMTGITTRKFL